MKLHIPNSAFLGNINPFIRSFDPSDPSTLGITANKKWLSVHPMVLSMIASLGMTVPSGNVYCEKLEAKSKHYLKRMGLFDFLHINSGIEISEHESAGRFIPLAQIRSSEELTNFIQDTVPLLHLDAVHAEPVKYVLSEVVRNTLEHSGSAQGAILCAQFYKKSNSIRIGVADIGVGIKKTINMSHHAETDLDAIRLALTPGITGTTRHEGGTEFNAGAGLFFVKSIAKANHDFFVLYSGNALYKLLKSQPNKSMRLHADPFGDNHSVETDCPYWQGTVVGIDISLAHNEEFASLLDMIRKTYSKAIQERKKEKYKRARFI